jgi:hypothetical protein
VRLTKKPRIAVHGWQPVSAAHFWASAVMSWLVDDPHNVAQAESEAERETVSNWWSELSTTRLNDSKQSAIIVVIMQRLHESDVSGTILSGDEDWCHLMIPMEYDWRRHCSTLLGWNDPRGLETTAFRSSKTAWRIRSYGATARRYSPIVRMTLLSGRVLFEDSLSSCESISSYFGTVVSSPFGTMCTTL